ncbi:hypothetical protein GCM10023332_18900 [Luteimonas vadosa]|uniref:Diguanylate cyclase n=2 Tax=Luteimonas vadosa TaxID=1165507 RepID=A0ABP9E4A2_9GAMM
MATWLVLALTRIDGYVPALWPVNGLLVGVMLFRPARQWPWILLAAFLGNVLGRWAAGDSAVLVTAPSLANIVEILVVAGLTRQRVPNPADLSRLRELAGTAALATLLGSLLSALIVSTSVWFMHRDSFQMTWLTWFGAHVLGMAVFGTSMVIANIQRRRLFDDSVRRSALAAETLLLVGTCVLVFGQDRYPVLFLVFLPLLSIAYRHQFRGVLLGIVAIAVAGTTALMLETGPFQLVNQPSLEERILLLQTFLGAGCLITIPVALAVTERTRGARALRAVTDNMPALIAHIDPRERYTFANAHYDRLLGKEPGQVVGHTVREVRGDAAYQSVAPRLSAALSGEEQDFEHEDDTPSGPHHLQTRLIPDRDAKGKTHGVYALTFDISLLKQAQAELEHVARVDSLTGLGNRRLFDERLEQTILRVRRRRLPSMLLLLDLDRFKAINDQHGHATGDAVLKQFAVRLRDCVYEVDTVARLGGDEFAILLDDPGTGATGDVVARKVIAGMHRPMEFDGTRIEVATSIGIGFCASGRITAQALMDLADRALYAAKAAGRNTYRILRE